MNAAVNPNKKIPYIKAALAVVIFCVIVFAACFLWLGIANDAQGIVTTKNTAAGLEAQNQQIENFQKNYSGYQTNLATMGQSFIDPQNPVGFITFLETTATNAGIDPKISLLDAGQQSGNIVSFGLSCTENFSNVLNFTEQLENGPYVVQIKNITIAAHQDDGSTKTPAGQVDADFIINAIEK